MYATRTALKSRLAAPRTPPHPGTCHLALTSPYAYSCVPPAVRQSCIDNWLLDGQLEADDAWLLDANKPHERKVRPMRACPLCKAFPLTDAILNDVTDVTA